jgi:hypothetical protein
MSARAFPLSHVELFRLTQFDNWTFSCSGKGGDRCCVSHSKSKARAKQTSTIELTSHRIGISAWPYFFCDTKEKAHVVNGICGKEQHQVPILMYKRQTNLRRNASRPRTVSPRAHGVDPWSMKVRGM